MVRAVGYRGVPTPGLPFDEKTGTIPHTAGRVDGSRNEYVVGWIKRGPSGVIGSNKKDSQETVDTLVADLRGGSRPTISAPTTPRNWWSGCWSGSPSWSPTTTGS